MEFMPQRPFQLKCAHQPVGDQPKAIASIAAKLDQGVKKQTLLGVTGSGKTFTMANVIAKLNRPTIVLAPNKTLAAQLFGEFKKFFPDNAVEYFVSFYDYYQPEAYIPRTDTYIEKDMAINEQLDRMRHAATHSLLDRQDVLIVASVSCIYGLGSPEAYAGMLVYAEKGKMYPVREMMRKLVEIAYRRNDIDLKPGTFRVRGDTIDVFPMYEDNRILRISLFGDEIETIVEIDPLTGEIFGELDKVTVYPASHYVTPKEQILRACASIRAELAEVLERFKGQGKLLEAQRIEQRTRYDLEMLEQTGICTGIENYSRHLDGRAPGEKPPTLMDYLPKNALILIDESHITVPQLGGMFKGDRSRKETLVEHGFRLPSALDNRPLRFEEFEAIDRQTVYISATPGDYEIQNSGSHVVEQIIRPTGLIDPAIEVRKAQGQVDDLMEEIRKVVERRERVLVCTLTKRMAEELTDYYHNLGMRVRYLHSEIDTMERMDLLRDLRRGEYDVLVGINLLREGLDLPEVSLIAVLDADKEGYLRSERSLIQIVGRAARNVNGKVIFYADKVTGSMERCMAETNRRKAIQSAYNEKHGITPMTVLSAIPGSLSEIFDADFSAPDVEGASVRDRLYRGREERRDRAKRMAGKAAAKDILADIIPKEFQGRELEPHELPKLLAALKREMALAARALEFEKAAVIRDQINELEAMELGIG